MFKTETHLHTSEVSRCGKLSSDQMIKRYSEAGYKTVIVTDHFQANTLDTLGDISWEDKVAIFLSGYYRAKYTAEKFDMHVLLGAEFCFVGQPNPYLALGLTKEFLCKYPDLHKMSIAEFYPIAKAAGIYLIQAHPYRDDNCYPTPEYADAVEVYNGNPRHNDYNDRAEAYALENGFPITGGSDAHQLPDIAQGGIITEKPITTVEEYIEIVKSGKLELIKVEGEVQ